MRAGRDSKGGVPSVLVQRGTPVSRVPALTQLLPTVPTYCTPDPGFCRGGGESDSLAPGDPRGLHLCLSSQES